MLYYDRDHKVGAVGVLCPQAGNNGFSVMAFEAQFRSHKTNVRQRKVTAVFFVASDEKNNCCCFFLIRVFVLCDWKGQYLSCSIWSVWALKCTKRCCRVQQRECAAVFRTTNAHRYALWAIGAVHFVFGPRLVNILSDIEMQNWKCKMQNEGSATHYKASQGTAFRSGFLFCMSCFWVFISLFLSEIFERGTVRQECFTIIGAWLWLFVYVNARVFYVLAY